MHLNTILKILGVLLMVFSFSMLPPAAVAIFYNDGGQIPFMTAFGGIFVTGMAMWLPFFRYEEELRTRDGFLVVVLFWVTLGLAGAVPFVIFDAIALPISDAVFESVSGLTATGATVISGLDHLPRSLLYYRQQLNWLGGMGIIVLAVAILPMLGIGGMQLYKAETPGPIKDAKLTPRIAETAKALWIIYLGLTVACAVAYQLAGMDWFDAIGHAFSTVATGGFSTHDASIGYFNNPAIEWICCIFMVLGAVNFALHFAVFRKRQWGAYLLDPEFRFFISIALLSALVISVILVANDIYDSTADNVRVAIFQTLSLMTTTGFGVTDFSYWPGALPFLLVFISFIGGCGGSTTGGMKSIRILLILRQGLAELRRLIHPNAVMPLKLAGNAVPDKVTSAIWGFAAVYAMSFFTVTVALTFTGMDFVTSYSAAIACLNNMGPGLGEVTSHFGPASPEAKWILSFAMLLGRLEVFTLLVLFLPMFWRR